MDPISQTGHPSHARLTSQPPPKAGPLMAATVVLGEASIMSCRKFPWKLHPGWHRRVQLGTKPVEKHRKTQEKPRKNMENHRESTHKDLEFSSKFRMAWISKHADCSGEKRGAHPTKICQRWERVCETWYLSKDADQTKDIRFLRHMVCPCKWACTCQKMSWNARSMRERELGWIWIRDCYATP